MPKIRNRRPSLLDRAYAAAQIIAKIDTSLPFEMQADQVIAAFKGDADVFGCYDNQLWQQPNFSTARTVRNSAVYGPKLFASFR